MANLNDLTLDERRAMFDATKTRLDRAEAAREELEKFSAWISELFFGAEPNAEVDHYLDDVRDGWEPRDT